MTSDCDIIPCLTKCLCVTKLDGVTKNDIMFVTGVEDRQTVRVQVGTREVFITFRVSVLRLAVFISLGVYSVTFYLAST